MTQLEIQNNDGVCRLISDNHEIVLPPGFNFLVVFTETGITYKLKENKDHENKH